MANRILFILFIFSQAAFARQVKIGLLNMSRSSTMELSASIGIYAAFEGEKKFNIGEHSQISLTVEHNKVSAKYQGQHLGAFERLKLISDDDNAALKIKSASIEKNFEGNFEVKVDNGKLMLINYIDLDGYVEGVIEAESGNNKEVEFLKVQAVICRTYALSHLKTHEGYDLCDQVHCQVYKGKIRYNHSIIAAVAATKGKIIVDKKMKPINSAFHSNCGGQTTNSEDVWSSPLSYLKSVQDSFCCAMPNAIWTKKISIAEWKKYLLKKDSNNVLVKDTVKDAFSHMLSERKTEYEYKSFKMPFKKIRYDWKLKSSYFNILQQGDSLTLIGKGYGHGVGMCQEGAMKMAAKGYSYLDIINFYYKDVDVTDIKTMEFLKND